VLKREDYLEHAEWLLNEGDPERASEVCRRGLRRFPTDHELWCLLGDSLVESGHYPEADRALRTASQLNKEWADPLAKRTEVLLMLGKVKRARTVCEDAFARDPNSALTSFMRGVLLDVTGQNDVARFYYRRAHKLDPTLYRKPITVSSEAFDEAVKSAVEMVSSTSGESRFVGCEWEVLETFDFNNPLLAGHAPLFGCYLITNKPEDLTQPPSRRRVPARAKGRQPVKKAFIVKCNVLRNVDPDVSVNTHIMGAVSDAIEDLFGTEQPDLDDFLF